MIVKDGIVYVLVPLALMLVLLLLGLWPVAILFGILAAFMAFFFRDPKRVPPADDNLVVSPADGRVTRVKSINEDDEKSATLVSIFLSPLDVHINRAPIAGQITNVSYTRGKFLMATDERASLVNEQNVLTIEGEKITVVCKQIAGILARRIVCWKQAGDRVTLGERFGLIKFSSRTDVLLPESVEVLITEGQRVKGGTTIIGRIR
ncbi:MAG TPA: phosphatidylserine decarboxylase family protein [Blastocatellia bacterium]|nr:phosphatidylserine decarboxylase family protein [Blastocatellia bacterium]HAF23215.1 phosphatidylserine decarboxylase family protein [Blastocatellia bacterium]HCX29983.1 phosphatidylserine decarboxylase family protein [Blastocatellia bacterium]